MEDTDGRTGSERRARSDRLRVSSCSTTSGTWNRHGSSTWPPCPASPERRCSDCSTSSSASVRCDGPAPSTGWARAWWATASTPRPNVVSGSRASRPLAELAAATGAAVALTAEVGATAITLTLIEGHRPLSIRRPGRRRGARGQCPGRRARHRQPAAAGGMARARRRYGPARPRHLLRRRRHPAARRRSRRRRLRDRGASVATRSSGGHPGNRRADRRSSGELGACDRRTSAQPTIHSTSSLGFLTFRSFLRRPRRL